MGCELRSESVNYLLAVKVNHKANISNKILFINLINNIVFIGILFYKAEMSLMKELKKQCTAKLIFRKN